MRLPRRSQTSFGISGDFDDEGLKLGSGPRVDQIRGELRHTFAHFVGEVGGPLAVLVEELVQPGAVEVRAGEDLLGDRTGVGGADRFFGLAEQGLQVLLAWRFWEVVTFAGAVLLCSSSVGGRGLGVGLDHCEWKREWW